MFNTVCVSICVLCVRLKCVCCVCVIVMLLLCCHQIATLDIPLQQMQGEGD